MVDYKAIGRRIALNRNRANMTQETVAERLDVSESFISQIERGKARISLPRLCQLADVFEIDVALLISDCSKIGDTAESSEMEQIIRNWTPEQRSMLIELVTCADKKMKSN